MKNFEEKTIDFEALKKNAYEAMAQGNEEETKEAFSALFDSMAEQAKARAENKSSELYSAIQDEQILVARGVRKPITSKEMKYFNEAVKKQKLDGLEAAFPTTVIEDVLKDITKEHPLLSAIDTRYTEAVIKYIYSDPTEVTAYWSEIPADIKQILLRTFKSLEMTVVKLHGFIALPKGYFQLGPSWLANFVTTSLREVMTATLETGVVTGDGKLKPIGMMRKLSGSTDGVYPEKTAVSITEFTPDSLGGARALLSKEKTLNGQVALIANPETIATKIDPKLFFQNKNDGSWKQVGLPYGETIIPSYAVPVDKAIYGVPKNYLLAVAGQLDIRKYEETLAIEDMDLYIGKMFTNGVAKNANAFVVLDLAGVTGITPVEADPKAEIVKQDSISPKEETPSV
ncbi:phage major capsid protein [Facklamia sp. P12945]|uniref:phage major capsid protein n=1 Tax=Facklamia sp. P12945 TaxID=3421950 RepID=UPI003D184FE8